MLEVPTEPATSTTPPETPTTPTTGGSCPSLAGELESAHACMIVCMQNSSPIPPPTVINYGHTLQSHVCEILIR